MLRQRVITALVLVAILLPTVAASSPVPFAVLTLAMLGAAGWEWGRLVTGPGRAALACGVVVVAAGAALGAVPERFENWAPVWAAVTLAWVVGGGLALRAGPEGWPRVPRALRWAAGVALLALASNAFAHARWVGLNFLLSTLCVVWAADIAAYFAGRAFGRRKLAPTISPGKSWEGVYGGFAGVVALAAFWLAAEGHWWPTDSSSLFKLLLQRFGAGGLLASLLLLTALSVVGDLFESLVKRAAGVKDSSRLLPGHGGVLDRIDALLPVLPAALALITA